MGMLRLQIDMVGTRPLLPHNVQLADPENQYARDLKLLTQKKTKTDEDRRQMAKVEWFGGLYTDPSIVGPAMPTGNIRRMLVRAATITKQGKAVERALAFVDFAVPIAYDGPRELDKLFEDERFRNRAMVRVGMTRVARVRPQFAQWALTAEARFIDDAMNLDDFQRVVELAGEIEGLGDNRVNGYGRFVGTVKVL